MGSPKRTSTTTAFQLGCNSATDSVDVAMTRRCSHCCNNGHNSRTCPSRGCTSPMASASASAGGVRLFGVRLTDGSIMKKSASMGNLSAHFHSHSSAAASPNQSSPSADLLRERDGYLSDDPSHTTCSSNRRGERKKGVPWTEEEHRWFLRGLQKLGKGDWRGIARDYVTTRTPTQVASHAQKHFIRQTNFSQRKRRSSLFDMITDMAVDPHPVPEKQILLPPSQTKESDSNTANLLPSLDRSLKAEHEPIKYTSKETVQESEEAVKRMDIGIPPRIPAFFPAYIPAPLIWSPYAVPHADTSHHPILKPIPTFPKDPRNIDELVGISHLSLGNTENTLIEPSLLSLRLPGESSRQSRQSAFHSNAPMVGQL